MCLRGLSHEETHIWILRVTIWDIRLQSLVTIRKWRIFFVLCFVDSDFTSFRCLRVVLAMYTWEAIRQFHTVEWHKRVKVLIKNIYSQSRRRRENSEHFAILIVNFVKISYTFHSVAVIPLRTLISRVAPYDMECFNEEKRKYPQGAIAKQWVCSRKKAGRNFIEKEKEKI